MMMPLDKIYTIKSAGGIKDQKTIQKNLWVKNSGAQGNDVT